MDSNKTSEVKTFLNPNNGFEKCVELSAFKEGSCHETGELISYWISWDNSSVCVPSYVRCYLFYQDQARPQQTLLLYIYSWCCSITCRSDTTEMKSALYTCTYDRVDALKLDCVGCKRKMHFPHCWRYETSNSNYNTIRVYVILQCKAFYLWCGLEYVYKS